mmetsp:Transcript_41491/g.63326  ORF Transcript_41491/g.63326 Transcript_41491/m.63326 type:complete len:103 (+) Transcript_41491:857-1165(+)
MKQMAQKPQPESLSSKQFVKKSVGSPPASIPSNQAASLNLSKKIEPVPQQPSKITTQYKAQVRNSIGDKKVKTLDTSVASAHKGTTKSHRRAETRDKFETDI